MVFHHLGLNKFEKIAGYPFVQVFHNSSVRYDRFSVFLGMIRPLFLIYIASLCLGACREKAAQQIPNTGNARLIVDLRVDTLPLIFNQFNYTNRANRYTIGNFECYLSAIEGIKNKLATPFCAYQYISASNETSKSIFLNNYPFNTAYDSLAFVFGVVESLNHSNGLSNSIIDQNMEWPNTLGGGYHFMRFEGLYRDTSEKEKAYALHFGKTPRQVRISFPLNAVPELQNTDQILTYTVTLDLNRLLNTPHVLDFDQLPGSIMAIDSIQEQIRDNARFAFSLKSIRKN